MSADVSGAVDPSLARRTGWSASTTVTCASSASDSAPGRLPGVALQAPRLGQPGLGFWLLGAIKGRVLGTCARLQQDARLRRCTGHHAILASAHGAELGLLVIRLSAWPRARGRAHARATQGTAARY